MDGEYVQYFVRKFRSLFHKFYVSNSNFNHNIKPIILILTCLFHIFSTFVVLKIRISSTLEMWIEIKINVRTQILLNFLQNWTFHTTEEITWYEQNLQVKMSYCSDLQSRNSTFHSPGQQAPLSNFTSRVGTQTSSLLYKNQVCWKILCSPCKSSKVEICSTVKVKTSVFLYP